MNTKKTKLRHIITKTSENQRQRENIRSSQRKKRHIIFKEYIISLAVDFYTDTMEARRQEINDNFKLLKVNTANLEFEIH